MSKQGIVYAPYKIVFATEPNEEYDVFMKEYKKMHDACPKCNSIIHSTTLVGYILDMSEKEKYKDKNRCVCLECGDTHITHDRVKKLN